MRIQHNIMAMNSYRNYNNNVASLSGNLEKLSSGYKINRAGDDAAGLAISEKMRAQITGLDAAQKNVKDATSLIKTAEGALQEVQDMLNRMVYLAEQSANGTYDSAIDRAALQDEVDSLVQEINRIGETANFNGMELFTTKKGGGLKELQFQIGDSAASADQLKMSVALGKDVKDFQLTGFVKTKIATAAWDPDGKAIELDITTASKALNTIRALRGDYKAMSTAKVGFEASTVAGSETMGAINMISKLRAKLGAVQNRLEHTANNLSVMEENIQDAESTIRDTDVAEEMMAYTKNNILVQSAQAMLAQANAVPQGVLQLLQ